jgi:prepilin-type processing-associated H-X9-DG protein
MTLVELLSVVAIIAILAAILFPVFARSREAARKHSCLSNLVNIGLALQLYADDHGDRFPPVDDDLSPLLGRYLRGEPIFMCPSSNQQGIPMGAPANRDLWPKTEATPPPTMGPPGPWMWPPDQQLKEGQIATNYYYRAGHQPGESPAAPIVTDQALHHNERANVLYTDGHATSLAEQGWREAGFKPIEEILNPDLEAMEPGAPLGGGG